MSEEAEAESNGWMTALEVARRFKVDDSTVRRWVRAGLLKGIRLPHRCRGVIRISRQAVEELEHPQPDL